MSNSINLKRKIKLKNTLLTIFITIIVTLVLGSTYAFLDFDTSKSNPSGETGCFEVNYTGQAIDSSDIESTEDYSETDAQTTVTLSKKTDCDIYTEADIYIETDETNTTAPIEGGEFKYKVYNGTTLVSEGEISQMKVKLATVPLTETAVDYQIYLWIDSTESLKGYHGKTYSGHIYAEAVQTSTVTE